MSIYNDVNQEEINRKQSRYNDVNREEINRKQSISLKPSGKESVMDPEKRSKSSIAILRPVGTIDALYTGTPRNRTTSLSTSAHERLESRRKRTVSVG